jgi:hypothetical protein
VARWFCLRLRRNSAFASAREDAPHCRPARRPFHPLDKRYRGVGVPRVSVHFSNDRPRSVEELDAKLHRQRRERASSGPPTRLPRPDTTQIFLLTKNAREDGQPRRPSPGRYSRSAAADRAPSSFGSPCRARPRGLFAWPLPARRAASERVCGLDASSRRARSRHVRVGEPPNRPRRHGRVSAPRRRRWPA